MIELAGRKQDVDALVFSPDGKQLAVGGSASAVQLWDLATGKARSVLGPSGPHRAVVFLADGKLLAVAAGTQLKVCALAGGRSPGEIRNDGRKHFTDVAFHPSGRLLAASSNNETVRLFDAATLTQTAAFDWLVGPVRRIAFA